MEREALNNLDETKALSQSESQRVENSLHKTTRREFLKRLGIGVAGILAGSVAVRELLSQRESLSRRQEIENLIRQAQQDRERFTGALSFNERLESSFSEIKRLSNNIDAILNLPHRNFPRGKFEPWLQRIHQWERDYLEARQSQDELLPLIYRVQQNSLNSDEKRSLFEIPQPHLNALQVNDFERVGGSSGRIAQRIGQLLPPNFIKCTYKISYEQEGVGSAQAGLAKNTTGQHAIEVTTGYDYDSTDDAYFEKTGNLRKVQIWEKLGPKESALLAHEFAHNADWAKNPLLAPAERIQFLNMILNRMISKDRYHSSYVEIKNLLDRDSKKWNDPIRIRNGTYEYWADICELYFSGYQRDYEREEGSLVLPKEDQAIIEWLLARTDPEWLRNHGTKYPKIHIESD